MENCAIKPTELSHCQFTELHHLPKGSFLYQQGESAHEFYYVQAGFSWLISYPWKWQGKLSAIIFQG